MRNEHASIKRKKKSRLAFFCISKETPSFGTDRICRAFMKLPFKSGQEMQNVTVGNFLFYLYFASVITGSSELMPMYKSLQGKDNCF